MNDYIIITDSGSDLPAYMAKDMSVRVLPLNVTFDDGVSVPDDQIPRKEFYDKLRSGQMAKTSAVNIDEFFTAFEPYLQNGTDVLYIGFSSGLSSTYQASKMAAEELREKYPERKIFTVDSLCASLGQGLLVYYAVLKKSAGKSIEETAEWLEGHKMSFVHWFTVDDLNFLKRGGRVSATTALVGGMLQIKPVMHVDDEGHLTKVTTARGRRASIKALFDKIPATATRPENQIFFISHGDCLEDAEYLAGLIKEAYPGVTVVCDYVGAVIGAHSGPGTLALFFLGSER